MPCACSYTQSHGNLFTTEDTEYTEKDQNEITSLSVPSVSSVVKINTHVSHSQQLTSHPRPAQTRPLNLTTPYPHPAQDSPNFPPNRPLSGCSCAPNSSNPRSFSPTPPFPLESPLCESSFSAILGVHPSAVCSPLQRFDGCCLDRIDCAWVVSRRFIGGLV